MGSLVAALSVLGASCSANSYLGQLSGSPCVDRLLNSHLKRRGQALFRSYGRLFAEFLNEESLVHLGLLDLSTCVGLRYG